MKDLVDTHVSGEAVRETEAVYAVNELGKNQDPQAMVYGKNTQ